MTLVCVDVADERQIVNSRDEIDLAALRDETAAVCDRLRIRSDAGRDEWRGSFITVLVFV